MLDMAYVRENTEEVRRRLADRGFSFDVETFQRLDGERKTVIHEVERLRQLRNSASEDIARLMKQKIDATEKRAEVNSATEKLKEHEDRLREVEEQLNRFASTVPNLPDADVPVGPTEDQNVELRRVGEPPKFGFQTEAHWDLCPALGIMDLDRATKIAGARFPLLAGAGARLERALMNFMLDIQTRENGYTELAPPFMVNSRSMYGTGQLPKFEEDFLKVRDTDYYLIPTTDVPVTNLYRDEIVDEARLPAKFTAFTPCFRSEAGSYERDIRGIFRVHQFNKVELVKFTTPETSDAELTSLTLNAEEILKRLELPYRVVLHSTGDMGFGAAKGYDLEVWLPGQNAYREISSCSNYRDFQARRANIRYRPTGGGKVRFLHTLNGSGLAIGRTWIAVMENFQQADGNIMIPKALRPYLNGQEIVQRESLI